MSFLDLRGLAWRPQNSETKTFMGNERGYQICEEVRFACIDGGNGFFSREICLVPSNSVWGAIFSLVDEYASLSARLARNGFVDMSPSARLFSFCADPYRIPHTFQRYVISNGVRTTVGSFTEQTEPSRWPNMGAPEGSFTS